jgi:hypothetical protein
LSTYARQRYGDESLYSVQVFYAVLEGRLNNLRRDLALCQQRLRHLEEQMGTSAETEDWAASAMELDAGGFDFNASSLSQTRLMSSRVRSIATRIVLPQGATDLDMAASQLLEQLTPGHWEDLDRTLQDKVLGPLGGLYRTCINSPDLTRTLSAPLVEGAAEYLGQQLPIVDVTEAELSSAKALHHDWSRQAEIYYHLAEPFLSSGHGEELGFLQVPASASGRKLGDLARQSLRHLNLVRASGQADLFFCREQARLGLTDLQSVLELSKAAYERLTGTLATTPHVRCDILDWIPLDP